MYLIILLLLKISNKKELIFLKNLRNLHIGDPIAICLHQRDIVGLKIKNFNSDNIAYGKDSRIRSVGKKIRLSM